ncbi:hypothetical protein C5167_020075, partial [Papaver somniferum]
MQQELCPSLVSRIHSKFSIKCLREINVDSRLSFCRKKKSHRDQGYDLLSFLYSVHSTASFANYVPFLRFCSSFFHGLMKTVGAIK